MEFNLISFSHNYRGPDINLVKVDWFTLNPPRNVRTDIFPIPGIKLSNASGTDVTILDAQ